MMNPTTDIDSDNTEIINATLTKFSSDIFLTSLSPYLNYT